MSVTCKTCFFIGHRDAPDTIYPALLAEVERHITEFGVGEFIVGHYGRFDSLAARAMKEPKVRHPEVELTLLLPYHPAKKPVQKPEGFDSLFYPPGMEKVPYRAAIVAANRYVVDHVDYLITYAWQPGSNARALMEYAYAKKNSIITNLKWTRVCFKTSILPNHSPQKGKYQKENRKISPVFQAFQAQ